MSTSSSPLCIVLAGGRGTRLHELTATTCKPAIPFIGACRIVDWTMANLARSGVSRIVVALQYRPRDLSAHIDMRWSRVDRGRILQVHGPDLCGNDTGFRGTADALRRILAVSDPGAAEVLVLGADHIYDMDYDAMIAAHRASGALATLGTYRAPRSEAHQFGVVGAERSGKVSAFIEKPAHPPGLSDDPETTLVSMGIYVFDRAWAVATLKRCADIEDIGRDLLPLALAEGGLYAHTGQRADGRAFYWRDVGTLDAYRDAHRDFLRARPCSIPFGPPPSVRSARLDDDHNVIMPGGWVDSRARLARTIVAPDARVGRGIVIGEDPDEDARWFRVSAGGTRLVTPAMLARYMENRNRAYMLGQIRQSPQSWM